MAAVANAAKNFTENLMKQLEKQSLKFWKIMHRADYLLIIFLLVLATVITILLKQSDDEKQVEIFVEDKLLHSVPLNKDTEIELPNLGVVQIVDGRYRLIKSTCENHLCEKQGWNSNLPIICVPNKIAVVAKQSAGEMIITK